MDSVKRWDKSHARRSGDKQDPSRYAQQVEKEFRRNSIVTDLGGGMGTNAIYFLQQGHKVIDVDISPVALEQANRRAAELKLDLDTRRANIGSEPLPIDDNSLDIVFSRLSLHYFDHDTMVRVFREIYQKLKKGGRTYITLKSPKDDIEMDYLRKHNEQTDAGLFENSEGLKSRFTVEQLKSILTEAGIPSFEVKLYREDLRGRSDWTKTGNMELLLNEVKFVKK